MPPRRRFSLNTYGPTSYDYNFCLKPPLMLWLVIFCLSRALVLPFVGGLSSMTGSANMASVTRGLTSSEDFVPAAMALMVLMAFLRRRPSGSQLTRYIWAHGRVILALSALADLALAAQSMSQEFTTSSMSSLLLVLRAFLDVYFLIFIFASRRVRDVFADFPARAE